MPTQTVHSEPTINIPPGSRIGIEIGTVETRLACSACGATSLLSIPRLWQDYSLVECSRQTKIGS